MSSIAGFHLKNGTLHWGNWPALRTTIICLAGYDHLVDSSSYKEEQFLQFGSPVKNRCPNAEIIIETLSIRQEFQCPNGSTLPRDLQSTSLDI